MVKDKVSAYLRGLKPVQPSRRDAEEDGTRMRFGSASAAKIKVPKLQIELDTVNPDMDEPLVYISGCPREYVVKWGG